MVKAADWANKSIVLGYQNLGGMFTINIKFKRPTLTVELGVLL